MKKLMLSMLFILIMGAVTFGNSVVKGNTHSDLGKYKIELTETVTVDGEELTAYVISYENSPLEIKINVNKNKKIENYVASSNDLFVKYVYNGKYFGILTTNNHQILNRAEYFHQKVLTQDTKTEIENIQLIAGLFSDVN